MQLKLEVNPTLVYGLRAGILTLKVRQRTHSVKQQHSSCHRCQLIDSTKRWLKELKFNLQIFCRVASLSGNLKLKSELRTLNQVFRVKLVLLYFRQPRNLLILYIFNSFLIPNSLSLFAFYLCLTLSFYFDFINIYALVRFMHTHVSIARAPRNTR